MPSTAQLIRQKSYSLGFEKCGIIPIHALAEYANFLEERIQTFPNTEQFYHRQKQFAHPLTLYPWAKSVVVMSTSYEKYKVPPQLNGRIGKSYLFDTRVDANTQEFKNRQIMDQYLKELGLKTETNQKFGVIALRWAARQAGLGIVRKNNFFYTESGSWVHLDAWITDKEMELKETNAIKACPKGCERCVKSCPTHSLCTPYTMSPITCVSFLTTFGGSKFPNHLLRKSFGKCIYGCDICQDVCPMNQGTRQEFEEFPNLSVLSDSLTPESILQMDESFYREHIQPKFFYLTPDELWVWKINVLNYMRNNYQDRYLPYLVSACESEYEKIREVARSICSELNIF